MFEKEYLEYISTKDNKKVIRFQQTLNALKDAEVQFNTTVLSFTHENFVQFFKKFDYSTAQSFRNRRYAVECYLNWLEQDKQSNIAEISNTLRTIKYKEVSSDSVIEQYFWGSLDDVVAYITTLRTQQLISTYTAMRAKAIVVAAWYNITSAEASRILKADIKPKGVFISGDKARFVEMSPFAVSFLEEMRDCETCGYEHHSTFSEIPLVYSEYLFRSSRRDRVSASDPTTYLSRTNPKDYEDNKILSYKYISLSGRYTALFESGEKHEDPYLNWQYIAYVELYKK